MLEIIFRAMTEADAEARKQYAAAAKEKITKYFNQLRNGCGNLSCSNDLCASCTSFCWPHLSASAAAVRAVQLLKQGSRLCGSCVATSSHLDTSQPCLTEDKLCSVIVGCQQEHHWSRLIHCIGETVGNIDAMSRSFRKMPSHIHASSEDGLDLEGVRRSFDLLFSLAAQEFHPALVTAISSLSMDMARDLQYFSGYSKGINYVDIVQILLEIPCLHNPEYMENAFPAFLNAVRLLPMDGQLRLINLLSLWSPARLRRLLQQLQQLITVRVVTLEWSATHIVNDDSAITSAVQVMKIVYYASLCGGLCDSPSMLAAESAYLAKIASSLHDYGQGVSSGSARKDLAADRHSDLEKTLHVRPIDCRKPLLSFEEFVNEVVNEKIEMDQDFTNYKSNEGSKFSFLSCPFVLSTATKSVAMFYDNRLRMINERRTAFLQSLLHGAPSMPYLRLRVRRDHLIDDALIGLEVVFMDNPSDLKKQLYVEFEGEHGIDEGGVSKEFFQLIVEELFNPDFGMFTYIEETSNFWFNPDSLENEAQFTLIGIVLGLAIYNNVILDINLPMVVYRKLMGKLGTMEDLRDSHPTLLRSLSQLLEHEGNVEEDLMMTFTLSRQNVYGSIVAHALKENGEELPVTNSNREEFVRLYSNFLLNGLVEKQFEAFAHGFLMVTDESPLQRLFQPSEVELLVCGSRDWDFRALQTACEYDGGFTANSPIICHFWDIAHAMTVTEKRLLLQFATGSDRVPVGGLSRLRLVITRHGPDSLRLPTAHTCFNVLLLPEYSSHEKLRERLLTAITHAKGFGML